MKTTNFKKIILIQAAAVLVVSFILSFIQKGTDKHVLKSILIGFVVSLFFQFVIFGINPKWFGSKVKRHPHQG